MEKFLLCRPRGGLNDTLNQIEKCWQYAETHRRTLYIDTTRSGMLDDFNKYFVLPAGVHCGVPRLLPPHDCFPTFLAENFHDYPAEYDSEKRNLTFLLNNECITFDFSRSYPHRILIHDQYGSGIQSIQAMRRLRFAPDIAGCISQLLGGLGEYDAIHVRNTDYQTDYRAFFDELSPRLGERIVLCTDDFACHEYARSLWGRRLLTVTQIPDTLGKPLHYNPQLDRFAANMDTLVDLMALALGQNLYFTTLEQGFLSGFTKLASGLHKNRDIVKNLLWMNA